MATEPSTQLRAMKNFGALFCSLLVALAVSLSRGADARPRDEVTVGPRNEKLIDGALKYLAARQLRNGAWEIDAYPTAFTSYALIAFMSAGHLSDEGPYGDNVTRGMQYLLDSVRPDGYIAARKPAQSSNMYGHGIATLALAELYGQTRNPEIRPKLVQAVRLIVNCQNEQGGWSYGPKITPQLADSSQTVFQLVALRAAKNDGLDVPQETIDRAIRFLRDCYDKHGGGFGYGPRGFSGFGRTAAAIYSLQVCGLYSEPSIRTGSKYLFDHVNDKENPFFDYGVYYASPAQYMIGGDTWRRWYGDMSRRFQQTAESAGGGKVFWPGKTSIRNDVYTTSIYTTVLAIPYHYLPLYQR